MAVCFKFNNETFTLPTSWQDITLGQYIEVSKADAFDQIELLCILTGLKREEVYKIHTRQVEEVLLPGIAFLSEAIDLTDLPMPNTPEWDNVPEDLGEKTYGQKCDALELIKSAGEDNYLSILPELIAIYTMEGEYDYKEMQAYTFHVKQRKLVEAYPVGCFFLSKL